MKNLLTTVLGAIFILSTFSCSTENSLEQELEEADLRFTEMEMDVIDIHEDGLFPEGIDYDKRGDRFLITSITRGDIGQIVNGEYSVWVSNPDLVSTIGLHVDHSGKRVLFTNSNIDGSLAALVAYDLSGQLLFNVHLEGLSDGLSFANDVTVDNKGNAYVTDSYAGIIYKVDPSGNAEIFLISEALAPSPGTFGLNGIEYHPRGFLIVARSDNNTLYKIPLRDPESFSVIELSAELYSPDGLYLKNPNELIVVNNDFGGENARVQTFRTRDGWETGKLTDVFLTPGQFLTTATVRRNVAFVLSAHLDILLSGGSTDVFSILKVK